MLCWDIYAESWQTLGGEHPIPIMSSFHRQSLSPGQISAKFHSFPQKWPFTMGIEEIPRFFVDLSVGLMWHVIQNTTLTQIQENWEIFKPCKKKQKVSRSTSLTWNFLLVFLAFSRGHLGFPLWEFHDQSLPSFGGLETPNAPWCSGLRFRCKDQRMDATNEKYFELRSFKRHYRTNTQTHIINKQSEVPCGTQKCDSSVFEWHQYLPSFKIVNGYRNRRMILVCHRKFSPKSSHLIFPTKPPGRGRIH